MLDDGGATTDLPDRSPAAQPPEDRCFGGGEIEQGLGVGDLIGGLAEQHPGLGVGQQPGGDLGRGGSVVGLGAKVRETVDDGDVGDAVGAAQLPARLEVAARALIREQRPRLVEHLEARWAVGSGEDRLEPGRHAQHHEREGVGVLVQRREVEDDARP